MDNAIIAWLEAMIRQYGVQLLFAIARVIGFAVVIGLTVVVVNWRRDRDERRNVGEKEREIIERLKQEESDRKRETHNNGIIGSLGHTSPLAITAMVMPAQSIKQPIWQSWPTRQLKLHRAES